jgi:hypothetical protein
MFCLQQIGSNVVFVGIGKWIHGIGHFLQHASFMPFIFGDKDVSYVHI